MRTIAEKPRAALVLLCACALAGCAADTRPPVTISRAIEGVQADLARIGLVGTSHIATWSAAQSARFDSNVRNLQCRQNTPDPVVAMIAGPVTMTLNGSYASSGSFSINADEAFPVFALQAETSRSRSQTLSLPVEFVALGTLADAEAARQIAYSGALLGQPDSLRRAEGQRIMAERDALSARIAGLIATAPIPCPAGADHPFVGSRATR